MVVVLWTELTERLDPGSILITPRQNLTVESARPFGDRWIVQFEGIHDRTAADDLRGVELEAEPMASEGTLFVHELIGSSVRDPDGVELGTVTDVEANPASDLLVLEGGGLIPLQFVVEHDAGSQVLVVDLPEGLLDL